MEGAMLPSYTMVDGDEDMVRDTFWGSSSILQTLVISKREKGEKLYLRVTL